MLTGKQKQYLRSQAVSFPAVVQIGKEGLTNSVLQSAEAALKARELIKIKVNRNSDEEIREAMMLLAKQLHGEVVQIIGRNGVLFKKKDKNSHYEEM